MKHNERISPEAWIVYPEYFLFSTIKESKTCRCCTFSSLHSLTLYLHLGFVSLQKTSKMTDIQGWPHCSFLIRLFLLPQSKLLLSHASNIQQTLLWNCTDRGQRLISLSLLTNPGLRVCILLAFRPLWFNIALPDMTFHDRQRLCDISLVPGDKEMVVLSAKAHQSYMNN